MWGLVQVVRHSCIALCCSLQEFWGILREAPCAVARRIRESRDRGRVLILGQQCRNRDIDLSADLSLRTSIIGSEGKTRFLKPGK